MPLGQPFQAAVRLTLCTASCALLWLSSGPALRAAPAAGATPRFCPNPADNRLLDEIERTGFQFFVEQADPHTGLVRDRARADGSASEGKASVAASGFAFNAWVIATERGWVKRADAVGHVRSMLRFLATKAPRQHGFFYHFMDMNTGARAWQCELSSIDSSLLYAGAIVAREYFTDPEITSLVNRLLDDIDWNWFRNGGQLVTLSWHDETGFSRYRWNAYSEHLLMSFMGLGVSRHPLEADYWQSWQRRPLGRYHDYVYLQEPPLFVNQFPQAFIDLRNRRDAFADYFRNTRLATLAQRQFSVDLRPEFPAWSENLWGLTASDSATGYKAWGGPPRTTRDNSLDGTLVPCAAAGSLPFAPQETLAVLHTMRTIYGDRIWSRYGFVDAFNPNTGWVNPDVLGIDVGISIVQAENLRTGLINRLFMQAPETKLSLHKAGFLSYSRDLDPGQQAGLLSRAKSAWQGLQTKSASPGLQLTALIAAQRLGLVGGNDLVTTARALLVANPAQPDAFYAAALIALRQSAPAVAADATRLLDETAWRKFPAAAAELGALSRLGVFLQIASGTRPASDWLTLSRATQPVGAVNVLAPADVAGALLPGLWLDESTVLSGASASQLAYASLTNKDTVPADPLLSVLQLDQFPIEALALPPHLPATPEAAAAFVITAANLLGHDCVRRAFQADPLVQTGRAAIAEFGEAAFGPNTSVIAQRELAGSKPLPPPRQARIVSQALPNAQWDWQTVAGLEFKDSDADVRPGDAPLAFRFALTWDQEALYVHAEVTDTPAGYSVPRERRRAVEVFINPDGDGFNWSSTQDYQSTYRVGAPAHSLNRHPVNEARITPAAHGYTVETSIPWSGLGLVPHAGLEFGLTVAAVSESPHEWEQIIKLNWSWAPLRAGAYQLGRVQLE